MRKTLIAACAGVAAACSMPVAPPVPDVALAPPAAPPAAAALARAGRYGDAIALLEERVRRTPDAATLGDLGYAYYLGGQLAEAQAALERACLMAPASAVAWERLAALLEAGGDSNRALQAMRHARLLRERAEGSAPGNDGPAREGERKASGSSLWPDGMARVEVRRLGAGLVEVARVEPAALAPRAASVPAAPATAGRTRLEVSNGNGVRGMAAAVALRLRAEGMQVVRLTNTIPFNVEETRVEVRGSGEPQLRIVLGKDAGIKKPPGVSGRQAP